MSRIADLVAPPRLGRDVRWLLASNWVANIGDGITLAAGPLLAASQTRNPLAVAMATFLGITMRGGLIVETLTHLALALTRSVWVALTVFFIFGAHASNWGTTSTSVRQRAVPAEFQGRVGSVYLTGMVGGLVVGTALGGAVGAGDFGAGDSGRVPDAWLELVLARIRVGPARSPWTAMGALGLSGDRIVLGSLGRRPLVGALPGRLTASIGGPRVRLLLLVTTDDSDPVAATYADPRGGTRTVRHAALAGVTLSLRRPGPPELTLSSRRGAYEYGTAQPMPGIEPQPLPEG